MGTLEIAKAGWLYRQTSVLHRWKKSWFVLYRDGLLKYFESPDVFEAEDAVILRLFCQAIVTSQQLDDVTTPEDRSRSCLFRIVLRERANWTLCAESADDLRAWQLALEELRWGGSVPHHIPAQHLTTTTTSVVYPPGQQVIYPGRPYNSYSSPFYGGYGGGYPGAVISPSPGATTVLGPPSQPNVVYVNGHGSDGYRYNHYNRYNRYRGMDATTGFVAGAAVGSLMFAPMMYW